MTRRPLAPLLALLLGACSQIFLRERPASPVRTPPRCSTSRIPPVIDLGVGIPSLSAGVVLIVASRDPEAGEDGTDDEMVAIGALLAAIGGAFTWSGLDGLRMARDCDDAEAELDAFLGRAPSWQPPRYPPPIRTSPTRPRPRRRR